MLTATQGRRLMRGVGLLVVAGVLALFSLAPAAQPGPIHTYTCQWTHDGVNTDTYEILVDGVQATTMLNTVATCPAATPRVCTSPLPMTTNVAHTVIVQASNAFGSASSDPFAAAPPGSRPASVTIKK